MNQRMFHGDITAHALADQLSARFAERHTRTSVVHGVGTALVQIGSKHGTPLTVNVADTPGGVLVSMSADRDWLDRAADIGEMIERVATGNLISLLAIVPDVLGELKKENLAPRFGRRSTTSAA